MRLVKQHDFHDEGVKWIQTLDSERLVKLGLDARRFAEENLSWKCHNDCVCVYDMTIEMVGVGTD